MKLLPRLRSYLKSSSTNRLVMRSPSYEEQQGFAEVDAKFSTAELLETPMQALPVTNCTVAENLLNYFMDGIQRSYLLYYQDLVPVYYGYTAAVIRYRQQAIMSKWQHQVREALYLPFEQFNPTELENLRSQQLPLVNTALSEPSVNQARQNARNAITLAREHLEAELAETWINSKCEGWLAIDGSITISALAATHSQTVGLIKSHHTQYFHFADQEVILNLRQGERSAAFVPRSRHPVCSWYLRLRQPHNQDPYFGLVRVETALTNAHLCDRLSSWLMTERRPLSLPDPRWDKMIYPIRDCEQFLRSQEPSSALFMLN